MPAGSRIGWAIVGDESIAALMSDHVARASGYVQENQLRATHLLQYVLGDYGMAFFPSSSSDMFMLLLLLPLLQCPRPLPLPVLCRHWIVGTACQETIPCKIASFRLIVWIATNRLDGIIHAQDYTQPA